MFRSLRPLALLSVALLSLPAWATDYTWTGLGEGTNPRSFSNSANWSPEGVPGADDTITVGGADGYEIAMEGTVRGLTIQGGALLGSITVASSTSGAGTFSWTGGAFDGATVTIAPGSTLTISGSGSKEMPGTTLVNQGTIIWTGGSIGASSDAEIVNAGLFDCRFAGVLTYSTFGGTNTAVFTNSGTLLKSAGTGPLEFQNSWGLHTTGVVNITAGSIILGSADNSVHVLSDGAHFNGGPVLFRQTPPDGSGSFVTLAGTVVLGSGASMELSPGTVLSGAGTFSGGTVIWSGGEIAGNFGTDSVTLSPTTTFSITGPDNKLLSTVGNLINLGTATWTGTGWLFLDSSTFHNVGSFTAANDSTLTINAEGTFDNTGTFTKQGTPGVTSVDTHFHNSGTVVLASGTLNLENGNYRTYTQTAGVTRLAGGVLSVTDGIGDSAPLATAVFSGGTLTGAGTLHAHVSNAAEFVVGGAAAAGRLTIDGDYTQAAAGKLTMELGGTAASAFDQVVIGGKAILDGTLDVALLPGYTPAKGDSFEVAKFATTQGQFSTVKLPTGVDLTATYSPTSVTVGIAPEVPATPKRGCSATAGEFSLLALLAMAGALLRRRPALNG